MSDRNSDKSNENENKNEDAVLPCQSKKINIDTNMKSTSNHNFNNEPTSFMTQSTDSSSTTQQSQIIGDIIIENHSSGEHVPLQNPPIVAIKLNKKKIKPGNNDECHNTTFMEFRNTAVNTIDKQILFKEKEAKRLREYRLKRKIADATNSEKENQFREKEAQRLREYRKKRKLSKNSINLIEDSDDSAVKECNRRYHRQYREKAENRQKEAERHRAYRLRKKSLTSAKEQNAANPIASVEQQDAPNPTTTAENFSDNSISLIEDSGDYRKKRTLSENSINSIEDSDDSARKECYRQKHRRYREMAENRQKEAERHRAYRLRKKSLISAKEQNAANPIASVEQQDAPKPTTIAENQIAANPTTSIEQQDAVNSTTKQIIQPDDLNNSNNSYTNYNKHKIAHKNFHEKFKNNPFGYACSVCDRLWFKNDLKAPSPSHTELLKKISIVQIISEARICSTCKTSLDKNEVPNLAADNGFKSPDIPTHIPKIDFLTERLIPPRIPFMQIRKLRYVNAQYGIYGQIINVPASIDDVVKALPRKLSDERCIYVHIKKKIRHKSSYVNGLIDKLAVPICKRTASIPSNRSKTVEAQRNHLPLIPGCSMTIHKSQGGSYDEIVYEYDKSHILSLALSRVTNIEGLFISTKNDDLRFYHGRRTSTTLAPLVKEFQRLSMNKLDTFQGTIKNFITSRNGVSLFTFNCQSLRKHFTDLQDAVIESSNFLLLSETRLSDNDDYEIPNFDCVVKFERTDVGASGVAIYKNNNVSHIHTPHMKISVRNSTEYGFSSTSVGDICFAQFTMDDGREIIMAVVYISPQQKIPDIITFLHKKLYFYSERGSKMFGDKLHEAPLILAGDFNVNFASNDSLDLIQFLQNEFHLQINNNKNEPTIRFGTTTAVFSRYIDKINSRPFVSYFSYHRPIVTFIESHNQTTASNHEVSNATIAELPNDEIMKIGADKLSNKKDEENQEQKPSRSQTSTKSTQSRCSKSKSIKNF